MKKRGDMLIDDLVKNVLMLVLIAILVGFAIYFLSGHGGDLLASVKRMLRLG